MTVGSGRPTSPTALVGTTLGTSFTLDKLLGQGRHGATFDGRHLRLGRHYVVRVLALDPTRRAAVATAMSQYAAVIHPNLLSPHDILTLPDEQLAICVPLLPGADLIGRVASQGKLSTAEATVMLRQAAAALHALHRRGLVHGNLSAGNIFFGFHDDISVDNALGSSKGGQIVRLLDAGLYLCDLLGGQAAPTASDDQRTLGRLLLTNVADLPAGQRRVLERAQSDRPESRYPSVLDMWQAFDAAAGKAPGKFGPTGSVATALVPKITLRRKRGGNRTAVIAGAAVVVLVAASLIFFLVSGRVPGQPTAVSVSPGSALTEIHLAFDVNPPTATVSANGKSALASSGLTLLQSSLPVTVSIVAEGYQPKSMSVIPSGARTIAVTLTKGAPAATDSDTSKPGASGDGEDADGDSRDHKHKRREHHHHHAKGDDTEVPDPAMRSLPSLKKY